MSFLSAGALLFAEFVLGSVVVSALVARFASAALGAFLYTVLRDVRRYQLPRTRWSAAGEPPDAV